MREKIDEEVSVVMYYSSKKKKLVLCKLDWENKTYDLGKVDFQHSYMDGQERQHIYELCDTEQTIWFRLRQNSLNNHWVLEAIHDGNAD